MEKTSKRQAQDARQKFPAQGTQTEIVGGLKLKAAAALSRRPVGSNYAPTDSKGLAQT